MHSELRRGPTAGGFTGGGGSSSSSSTPISDTRLTSADFDEENFLETPRCKKSCCSRRCCFLRRLCHRPQFSSNTIFQLLQNVASMSRFRKEVVVLGAIYVERLLDRNPEIRLGVKNWRPLLVAALHLASKTWEDLHPWNAEVAVYLSLAAGVRYPARSLYLLESRFLAALGYRVDVCGQLYAAYYFALREAECPPSPPAHGHRGGSLPSSPELGRALRGEKQWSRGRHTPTRAAWRTSPSSLASTNTTPKSRRAATDDDASFSVREEAQSIPSSSLTPSSRQGTPCSPDSSCSAGALFVRRDVGISTSMRVAGTSRDQPSDKDDQCDRKQRQATRLDPQNPYIGTFRHAPRASPPSTYISRRR